MTLTTTATLTKSQLRELQAEAAKAGDREQVSLCEQALEDRACGLDDSPAISACVAVIRVTEAQS